MRNEVLGMEGENCDRYAVGDGVLVSVHGCEKRGGFHYATSFCLNICYGTLHASTPEVRFFSPVFWPEHVY